MECVVNYDLFILGNFYLAMLLVFAGLSFASGKTGATYLILLTAFFYWLSKFLHCEIKSIEIANFRYLAWTLIDVLYLCTVYYALFKRKKIKTYILAALLAVHMFAWLLHAVRIIDIHYLNADFYTAYGLGIAIYNFLIIAIVLILSFPSQ